MVAAGSASRIYGAANPAFSVGYSGWVNGDSPSSLTTPATAAATATAVSSVGTYPITASGATDANYTFTYLPGTLSIGPAPLTVTASNAGKTYGSANPAFVVGYSAGSTATARPT